jgi:hypothetical protein
MMSMLGPFKGRGGDSARLYLQFFFAANAESHTSDAYRPIPVEENLEAYLKELRVISTKNS